MILRSERLQQGGGAALTIENYIRQNVIGEDERNNPIALKAKYRARGECPEASCSAVFVLGEKSHFKLPIDVTTICENNPNWKRIILECIFSHHPSSSSTITEYFTPGGFKKPGKFRDAIPFVAIANKLYHSSTSSSHSSRGPNGFTCHFICTAPGVKSLKYLSNLFYLNLSLNACSS